MELRQLFDPTSSTYTYLLWDKKTREAALVDSVREQIERDSTLIRELSLDLKYLLETHIHADHITGAGELRKRFGAKSVVHRNSDAECPDILVEGGERLMVGENSIEVLFTPGHTNTDVSYLIDGAVLTGDALLIRGSGRTDFQSGDAGTAYDSITEKLFTLTDDTLVYPAHDYHGHTVSSIGEEKAVNPRLGNHANREDYIKLMDSLLLDKPKLIDEAVPGNLACGLARQDGE
ncbi:MAG: MBL fold metallo-hydrolase [Pseudomonadota bacterium]|nr:MBL fold metallo-hydrolase [Pseudomonadota bacterium]